MAIIVHTNRPRALLRSIKEAIDEGRVKTWSYDADGDFTHTASQWNLEAWLRPRAVEGELRFAIVPPQGSRITSVLYAIYHGRFSEMLLAHFEHDFDNIVISAMPELGDQV